MNPFELALPGVEQVPRAGPAAAGLVARARAGDQDAFKVIYHQHHPGVRRLLGDLLPSSAADDAAQETFVRAFTRMDTLRDDLRLRAWLLGIARMVALESHRAQRRWWPRGNPISPSETAQERSPQDLSMAQESVRALHWALKQLKESRRMALLLRADHGLSSVEVAQVMEWSVAKAKVEVHRARKELREWMDRYDGSTP